MTDNSIKNFAKSCYWNSQASGALSSIDCYIEGFLDCANFMKNSLNCQTWNEWQCPFARDSNKDYVLVRDKSKCPCEKWRLRDDITRT